jgi:peptidyl-prolyl cis-trans isomerase D
MLSTLRRGGVVQILMAGIVLVIIASFAFEFRGGAATFRSECALEVYKHCVMPRDFNTAFHLSVPPNLQPKQIKKFGFHQLVMDGLVERELLKREAEKLGISISEQQVDDELYHGRFHYSLPADRYAIASMYTNVPVTNPKTEQFDYDVYKRAVKNYTRMSGKDFKQYQTEELIAARMRELVKLPVEVSDAEAFATFAYERSRAVVRVAQLHWSWFARFVTPISENAVTAYMSEHASELAPPPSAAPEAAPALEATPTPTSTPEVALTHATSDTAPAPSPSAPAAPAEGCTVVSEIFFAYPPAADAGDEAETKSRAQNVRKQITQGRAFDALARAYSAAPSGSHGGLRGCLRASEGDEARALLEGIKSLKPGELSELLTLPHGVYLLRPEAELSAEAAAAAEKRAQARPLAARVQAEARLKRYAADLIAQLKAGQNMQDALLALSSAALREANNPPELQKEIEAQALEARDRPRVDISSGFSRADTVNPVPNLAGDVSAKQIAFTLEGADAVFPEPLTTRDGLAVLQLKEKRPATREDFDKDKHEIVSQIKETAQADALARYVKSLKERSKDAVVVNPRYLDPDADKTKDDS